MPRRKRVNALEITANIHAAICDLIELEKVLTDSDRHYVQNHRIGLEMAHRDIISLVNRVKPFWPAKLEVAAALAVVPASPAKEDGASR